MFLFKEDEQNELYKNAIFDYESSNSSFVRFSGLLKAMNIENHQWPLLLVNPLLKAVDPYNPNITHEEILMIVSEIKVNPMYFFREIARAPSQSGGSSKPFRANRGNMSLIWLFFNHITSLLIQPRQTGKSFSTDMLMTVLMRCILLNTNVSLLTKDDSLRVKNVTRLKDIADELPFYLQMKQKGDTNNTEKITVNRLGNIYDTAVAQSAPKAALKTGRGATNAINHIDEIAFISNIGITLPALLGSTGAARDEAAEGGEPYGNIFTTTAGYLNDRDGSYVYENIYTKGLPWTEKLYDCVNEQHLVETIKKNSPGKKAMVILEFNHRQLGYTDEWLRGKIADAMAEGDAVLADFLNVWPEGSSQSPIPKNLLKLLSGSVVNEPYNEIAESGYITRWYIKESELELLKNREVVMSLDTSDAVGRDDIAMVIRDVRSGETLAAGQYNETNLITFSEWLIEWLVRFPKLTMIIERRSSGVAILDNLIKILPAKGIDPFRRLFNWVVNDKTEQPKRYREVFGDNDRLGYDRNPRIYDQYRKYFGFATSGGGRTSREGLYGNSLLSSIKYTGGKARDKMLVNQISSLTVKNGRIDHKTGYHDDLVISWALAYWFLSHAANKDIYGIPHNIVLSVVISESLNTDNNEEKLRKQHYQLKLKQHIDFLLDKLRNEKNNVRTNLITSKIRHLYKDIDTSYIKSFNVDSILENIELEKKKNKNSMHRRY